MEWKRELRAAVKEGRAVLGIGRTTKLLKKGEGKFVVIASNCPKSEELKYYAKLANIELIEFQGNNVELGALARKPFRVSALMVK